MRILSLGAGVQSSTLALMAAHGEISAPDCAIFADTGWEPRAIYEYLNRIEKLLPFPVYRVQKSNLREDLIAGSVARVAAIPFFTKNGGMGMRQCTAEYKIAPIRSKARQILGYSPRQRIPAGSVEMLIGISMDELQRMKPSRDTWITNRWPLIEREMTRGHCLEWMTRNGYEQPPKSSCLGCPYHSDRIWNELKKSDEWEEIVYMDHVIRKQPGFKHEQFMHRSCVPIDQAVFKVDDVTVDMFNNECEGLCGV